MLCKKLQKAGIRGRLLDWFISYLENRKHRVKIRGTYSENLISRFGVPQGSVLGPFLFVISMNDLFTLDLKAGVISFADNTSLLYSASTKEDILNQYKHDRNILLPWFEENTMHLNINKCKIVIYAYKSPSWATHLKIEMDHIEIEKVTSIKYLGVVIDEKLT